MSRRKTRSGLTDRQSVFVSEYLVDLNAKQAAIRAGYSLKYAKLQACQLLRHPKVSEEIQKAMDKRAKRTEITADRVLQELAAIAFSDIRKLYGEDGKLLPPHLLPDDIAPVLAAVKVVSERFVNDEENPYHERTVEAKVWDKLKSLELLGKHLKLFTDKVEIDVSDSLAKRLKEARERTRNRK
jgi:phage terminase small subunit